MASVLKSVRSFKSWSNVSTSTNEIDLLVEVGITCQVSPVIRQWGSHFVCECKLVDKGVNATWVGKLNTVLELHHAEVGVLISAKGPPKGKVKTQIQFLTFKTPPSVIVCISLEDLKKGGEFPPPHHDALHRSEDRSNRAHRPIAYPDDMPVTLDQVWRTGLTFPNVEESTAFGKPALKVRGNLMAAVPTNKSAEPGSLLIRIDRNDRAALLAESPDLYYAPDHYLGYDGVLVRLARLKPDILRDLLAMAHKFTTRKPQARKPHP
jgi:hypothetical protein